MSKKAKKFLEFRDYGPVSAGAATIVVMVSAVNGGHMGSIRWFAAWRRYVFYPVNSVLFDCGCLREIAEHLEHMMTAHKSVSVEVADAALVGHYKLVKPEKKK